MRQLGEVVEIKREGLNYAFPNKYIVGMNLQGVNVEYLSIQENQTCIVIARNEFYKPTKLAITNMVTHKVSIVDEKDVKDYIAPATQEDAINSFKMCIEAEISLMYEEEMSSEHDLPENYDYNDWYEKRREIAYNLPHMVTLRRFIEGD